MTPSQHAQRIRQIAFKLEKADYGMGMPRDYQRVLELRTMLEQARKEAELMDSDYDEQAGGYDLLAMLHSVVRQLEARVDPLQVAQQARAAIAKAEGTS